MVNCLFLLVDRKIAPLIVNFHALGSGSGSLTAKPIEIHAELDRIHNTGIYKVSKEGETVKYQLQYEAVRNLW